jgi:nitrate reductase (NAD(P)H)
MLNNASQPYTVRGYAYAGGGRKIIRVEISLDLGKTWRLAEIRRFEKPTQYGELRLLGWQCWEGSHPAGHALN